MFKRIISIFAISTLVGFNIVILSSTASAVQCVMVKPSGKTVGEIQIGNFKSPIKSFTYPAGGIMEPQKSTMMAAVSERHMPLSASVGTSVIVWHANYAGCTNGLNLITKKPIGTTFQIKDEKGNIKSYQISKKYVVRKGNYQSEWFDLIGPRKLLLATCTGEIKNWHYLENSIIIATPYIKA